MESLNAGFFNFVPKLLKLFFEPLARNSSLIGDILEVFSKFTKFTLAIFSGGGRKASFYISRDHMINESHDSPGDIPSF